MADPIIGKISVGDGATFTPAVSNAGVLSWSNNKGLPNPQSVDMAQAVVDKKPGWGIPIGYEYFTFNPNIPQGALPLFGGEYSRTTYSDLWAWVQTQTGYLKTEAEWQTLSTANNGNVPYYSSGDGSTTFRVPSLKCWVKSANGTVSEVGSYLAAGLPNINAFGSFRRMAGGSNIINNETGAFSSVVNSDGTTPLATGSGTPGSQHFTFDASRSNSIYGNSTTVQPESIVGMWLVKAYGTVVDTGQIDEQQYIDDRIAAEVTRTDGKFLPLAGGTMGGSILSEYAYKNSTDAGMFRAYSGTDNTSSFLTMYGKNAPSYAGYFQLSCKNGSYTSDLIGSPNGSLTWGGNGVVTKKAEDISSSVSVTTSNGTVTGKKFVKVGNVVSGYTSWKTSSAVNVGGSITGYFTNLPARIDSVFFVNSSAYYGSTALLLAINNLNSYTIRVIGANLASGAEFSISFVYATVS